MQCHGLFNPREHSRTVTAVTMRCPACATDLFWLYCLARLASFVRIPMPKDYWCFEASWKIVNYSNVSSHQPIMIDFPTSQALAPVPNPRAWLWRRSRCHLLLLLLLLQNFRRLKPLLPLFANCNWNLKQNTATSIPVGFFFGLLPLSMQNFCRFS